MMDDGGNIACASPGEPQPRSPIKTVAGLLVLAAAIALGVYSLANRSTELEENPVVGGATPETVVGSPLHEEEQDTAFVEPDDPGASGCGCEQGAAPDAPAAVEQPACAGPSGPSCCGGGGE
jgi:hypothetical protein